MRKYLGWIVFLGFALSVNLYYRSFPINFPQLKAQARQVVEENIRQGIAQDINKLFSQYDPLAKDRLLKTNFAEYVKFNKKNIDDQVRGLYLKMKDRFQDENGQTHIFELDCWHWARYVENVVTYGHSGDEVVDGQQKDMLMVAPDGAFILWDVFLYHFSAFLYDVFSFFKNIPLFTFLFYLPLFMMVFFVIALYFFSYRYGGHVGALISCLVTGLSPIFIPRSCAGWFDKDIFSMLFPVLTIWAYVLAYHPDFKKHRSFWICVSGFWVGLFCSTWVQWWFPFLIVIIYELLSIFVEIVLRLRAPERSRENLKLHSVSLSVFIASSVMWIILFAGIQPFAYLYEFVAKAVFLIKPLQSSIWPNVFSTVGELKKINMAEVADSAGGKNIFVISLVCMAIILLRNIFSRKYAGFCRESIIIMTIWFLAMLYACFQGVRFALFIITPLSVVLGWAIHDIFAYFRNRRKILEGAVLVAVVFAALSFDVTGKAGRMSKGLYPLINDTWYKVLILMKNNTPKDAIINSWWDFGDWFKVISGRRVIFDGQSQTSPRAYWMAKAILSNNESESLGILRMLNNGGNKAFDVIDGYLKNPLRSALLLESIIPSDRKRAKDVLSEYVPDAVAEEVLHLLFDTPGPAYFVVDDSMQGKMPAISFLGNWNFSKVYIAQNFQKEEKDKILDYLIKLGMNSDEVRRYYQEAFLISGRSMDTWFSSPVQFFSQLTRGKESGGQIYFENGFIYKPDGAVVYSNSGQVPRSLFILRGNQMSECMYPNANMPFSILVFRDTEGYKSVLLDRSLGNSLFARLYFLGGHGMKYFTPQINADDGNNAVGVFKIEWNGKKESQPDQEKAAVN